MKRGAISHEVIDLHLCSLEMSPAFTEVLTLTLDPIMLKMMFIKPTREYAGTATNREGESARSWRPSS